ncbi:MAG: ATP-binding cassette domain-containing protein [Gordonia sp. (in: high G+C Gram-positive bacteria)]
MNAGEPAPGVGCLGLSVSVRNEVPPLAIDLDIPAGGSLAVMGPNGAGKTTLLHVVAGLLRPDGPTSVRLDGTELVGPGRFIAPSRRGIALLSQDAGLFPHLTVWQNVAFAPSVQRLARNEIRERTRHWLAATDTAHLADRTPSQLSGGQAQRVAIARAMAAHPRLLLLDEPFRALDVGVAARIRALLRMTLAERRQTALFVTHDIVDAVTLADSVLILADGRAAESGEIRGVLRSPRSEFGSQLAGVSLLSGRWDGARLHTAVGEVTGVPSGDLNPGDDALGVFAPAAASVFALPPQAASPRNIFAATVLTVEPRGDRARVRCIGAGADSGIGGYPDSGVELVAEVTWEAIADLGIDAGAQVYLTVKAGDLRIYP